MIEIGDDVTLAPNVVLLAHDASLKEICGLAKIGRITIGNNVFVGANTVVLPNVAIGNNVIIGAGSVITKNIPDNAVYAGNPAKFIRQIDEIKEKKLELLKSRPCYNQTFNPLVINNEQKNTMKKQLQDGFGFCQCENYHLFNN